MMEPKNKLGARKATWLAFGLIALAASISSAQETPETQSFSETTYVNMKFIIQIMVLMPNHLFIGSRRRDDFCFPTDIVRQYCDCCKAFGCGLTRNLSFCETYLTLL